MNTIFAELVMKNLWDKLKFVVKILHYFVKDLHYCSQYL